MLYGGGSGERIGTLESGYGCIYMGSDAESSLRRNLGVLLRDTFNRPLWDMVASSRKSRESYSEWYNLRINSYLQLYVQRRVR
jgi:hypothetical protein